LDLTGLPPSPERVQSFSGRSLRYALRSGR
jgi:hypothetical protein